jgi:hypothetical protein
MKVAMITGNFGFIPHRATRVAVTAFRGKWVGGVTAVMVNISKIIIITAMITIILMAAAAEIGPV